MKNLLSKSLAMIKSLFKKGETESYKYEDEDKKTPSGDKKKNHDLVAKIVCVLLAVFLWFYVIDEQSPTFEKTFSNISVTFSNVTKMPEGLGVISGENYTVDVVLIGKRSDLNRINADDIKATVDLSGVQNAGEYPLPIKILAPSNTSVKTQTPGSLYVYIDKTISKTFEIECTYTGGTSDNGSLLLGPLTPSRNYITVTGPEEEILKISNGLVNISFGIIDKTVRVREKIILVDQNGNEINNPYFKTDISEVDVSVPVYKVKEVPVEIQYKYGYFDEDIIKVDLYPQTVTIKGSADSVDSVDKIYTELFDEKVMESAVSVQLSCILPAGVTFYGSDTTISALLTMDNFARKNFVVNRSNILIQNLSKDLELQIIDETVEINFAGVESYLSNIYPGALKVYIDASSITAPGTYKEVPLVISRPAKNVYVSNEQECMVDIIVK